MSIEKDGGDASDSLRPSRAKRRMLLLATLAGILLVTLTPTAHGPYEPNPGVRLIYAPTDLGEKLLNVALFAPLGSALAFIGSRHAVLWGAALSVLIEATQLAIPGRLTSLADVILNTAGTAIGAALVQRALRRRHETSPA